MPDQHSAPPSGRFKAEMPQIPGVSGTAAKPSRPGRPMLILAGLLILLIALFIAGRFLSKPRHAAVTPAATPQIDVPSPVADLSAEVPVVTQPDSEVTTVTALAKPWAWQKFMFRDRTTGQMTEAVVIRLPSGTPLQAAGYWSFAMKPAYGNCQLEYVEDLQKLKANYGYRQAKHPMVANPCTGSLYDPLKYTTLPGNVLARGAVVQGSDLRPPYSIEIKVKGKQILAIQME
jgi:hypothetical protein